MAKETTVDVIIQFFRNNTITAVVIVSVLIFTGFDKASESGENLLRRFGFIKTFNVSKESERGQFSSQLLENAWNRMFWMRVYSERVKLKASDDEKNFAWAKYIQATELWSSRIMNYYIGLEEYYPNTGKRNILQETIQPKLIDISRELKELKYSDHKLSDSIRVKTVNCIQELVDNVNNDFYLLMSREDLNDNNLEGNLNQTFQETESKASSYYSKPDYTILFFWIISLILLWILKSKLTKSIENQSRIFLAYTLLTGIILIICKGASIGIPDEYLSNLTTEIIGITITVFLIDRVYSYVTSKNEELYRRLSLKMCKMPIMSYCKNWFFIFETDNRALENALANYEDLESFFKSDEFYRRIISFDFNNKISADKTYAQYYNEKFQEIADRFQNILAKYASKLSYKDIQLIEHFGGRAYMYSVFALQKSLSEAKFTRKRGDQPEEIVYPFNNSLKSINRENLNKHFEKLVELIDAYNAVVEKDYEKWTIKNIGELHTIKKINDNPATEW